MDPGPEDVDEVEGDVGEREPDLDEEGLDSGGPERDAPEVSEKIGGGEVQ